MKENGYWQRNLEPCKYPKIEKKRIENGIEEEVVRHNANFCFQRAKGRYQITTEQNIARRNSNRTRICGKKTRKYEWKLQ